MSLKTVLVVILAIVFGGSAAVGINNMRQARANPADMAEVVVAKEDIGRGTTVTADMLTVRQLPKNHGLTGIFDKPEDAVDRVALSNVKKGNPVLDINLADKGAGHGLAALIPKGMRAFTIQTPSVAAGVAGFLLPGNRVDVLLTVTGNGSSAMNLFPGATGGMAGLYPNTPNMDLTGGGSTTTLLQNIEVLAVDKYIQAPSDTGVGTKDKDMRSVTLLVTPDQAAKLDLGQNKGFLHLDLRHPEDKAPANTRPVTLADLRFYQEIPWDQRLRGVLGALAQVMSKTQPKPAPPAKKVVAKPTPPPPPPPPPPPEEIRTLHGLQDSKVFLRPSKKPAGSEATAANTR